MSQEAQRNATPAKRLTAKQEAAALALALDLQTDEEIAQSVGVYRTTLWRWKEMPDFAARIEENRGALRRAVTAKGIAVRETRLAELQGLYDRMGLIVSGRADDMVDAPGGESGLLARQYKQVGRDSYREEYQFDAALVREMRATLQQAAQEKGEWRTGAAGTPEDPAYQVNLTLEEWRALADERRAAAEETMRLLEGGAV